MSFINKLWILFIVSALCVGAGLFRPASVEANEAVPAGDIAEAWVGGNVSFTVTPNPDLPANIIIEFAVGNNGAATAGRKDWPLDHGWSGAIAHKDGTHWYTASEEPLQWLDNATNFGGYSTAFLYTTWMSSLGLHGGYGGIALPLGPTSGFYGTASVNGSPYAINTNFGFVDYGETTITNDVPEPLTLLLLGFGLAGLAGIRRKFKG